MINKVNIYTALYGGYDILQDQPKINNVKYTCFTDNNIKSNTWNIVVNDEILKGFHPRIRAKYFKILSHKLFPEENELTLWVDANVLIYNVEIINLFLSNIKNDFSLFNFEFI